jgi:hypothetical protein
MGLFAKALAAFNTALLLDSARSLAYYGRAKTVVRYYEVDQPGILEDLEKTAHDTSGRLYLLEHSDAELTRRLHAASGVRRVLRRLTDRDTLTRWWSYLDDTVTAGELADSNSARRRAFMQDYLLKADLGQPGYRQRADFPLSDLLLSATNLALDFSVFELVYAVTRLRDLDGNDTIDDRDSLTKSLRFGNQNGFSLDSLAGLGSDLENDPALAESLNAMIRSMHSGLAGTSELLRLILPPDTGSAGEEASRNIDSITASLGRGILFYQFGDGLDNDGDGCVDEEILDGLDNDLDGFVDEDARVIPDHKPDGVDNDHDGRKDPVSPPFPFAAGNDTLGSEARVGGGVNAVRPHLLGFVHAHLAAHDELAAQDAATTWVKIKGGDANLGLRLAIQNDSLAAKSPAQLARPYKAKLDSAKALVGGSWRNYPRRCAACGPPVAMGRLPGVSFAACAAPLFRPFLR